MAHYDGPGGEPVKADDEGLRTILHQLAGEASMCWENPAGAGVFRPDQAAAAANRAYEAIKELFWPHVLEHRNHHDEGPDNVD